jgi:hypothetical protein
VTSGGRGVVRPIVMALCIGVTIAGLLNVYGDNADVVRRAQTVACGKPECAAHIVRMERSPFSQTFTFQTRLTGEKGAATSATVSVECKREFALIGDYACAADSATH